MPQPYNPRHQQLLRTDPQKSARRPREQWRFRWEYVLVPLVLLAANWFLSGAEGPSFTFDDLAHRLGARDIESYRQLTTLGLILIGITLIVRTLRHDSHGTS